MRRKILLTGATGFVGRQVLRTLADSDVNVTVVVRDGTQQLLGCLHAIEGVITTPDLFAETSDWWADACKGLDTVIHVAWYVEPGRYLQSATNLDCLTGTLQLAKGSSQAGVKRFIGVGTCFEYELAGNLLTVETPLRPSTPYAAAKAAAFTMLSQWFPLEGVEFAWCRLFYLYGEGEDGRRLVPYLRKRLGSGQLAELTSGDQIRDFMDVRDAGRMIAEAAIGNICGPINICSGIPITVRQLAEKIADEYGSRDFLKFGVRQENSVDPACVVGLPSNFSS